MGPQWTVALICAVVLSGCAAKVPAARTFAIPAQPAPQASLERDEPVLTLDPEADLGSAAGAAGVTVPYSVPRVRRPSDAEFVTFESERHYRAGERALREGRIAGARLEFDRAVQLLMSDPIYTDPEFAEGADHKLLERRLQEYVAAISRLDREAMARPSFDPAASEASLTFPVEPGERNRLQDQLREAVRTFPMVMNDAVAGYIDFFQSREGYRIISAGLRRSGRYKAWIQRILAEEGVPVELFYLAQVESKFDPTAISFRRSCCAGLWQFNRNRAPEYDLQPTSLLDPRMDPEISTRAVARHLKDLFLHYGDWYMALAAHNCGHGCIDNAVLRTGYADFWELYDLHVLPRETSNFVPQILALIIMSERPEEYGLGDVMPEAPLLFETLELQAPTSLQNIATATGCSIDDLKDLNPALLKNVAPAGYRIRIPMGSLRDLEAALEVIPANRRESWKVHRVQDGDSAASLAKKYRANAAQILAANFGSLPEAGQFAAIPSN